MKLEIVTHLGVGIKHEYIVRFENAIMPKENTFFCDKSKRIKWKYLGITFTKANILMTGKICAQFIPIDHDEVMQEGETYYLVE